VVKPDGGFDIKA